MTLLDIRFDSEVSKDDEFRHPAIGFGLRLIMVAGAHSKCTLNAFELFPDCHEDATRCSSRSFLLALQGGVSPRSCNPLVFHLAAHTVPFLRCIRGETRTFEVD